MVSFKSLCLAALSLSLSANAVSVSTCASPTNSFNITSPSLYPESADYDTQNCILYLSSLYNQSALAYDPLTKTQTPIHIPNITGNPDYHIAGVTYDRRTGLVFFDASAATSFNSGGKNLSGPNAMVKYDPSGGEGDGEVVWVVGLEGVVEEVLGTTGFTVGGFQDIATDTSGNAYQVATFGNAIAKVTPDGVASTYYATLNPVLKDGNQQSGWGGIFSLENLLVMLDSISGNITTFDTTSSATSPENYAIPKTTYPPSNLPSNFTYSCDKFYAPPRFNGKVALCSNDGVGIVVFNSTDKWASASFVGQVEDDKGLSMGGVGTATVQIGESLYETFEFFDGDGGDRDVFPLVDITSEVLALLG